jgi:hypothetical protein
MHDGIFLKPMNANEITSKANARLRRIKVICRVLKILFLFFLACRAYVPFVRKMPDGYWIVCGTYATFAEVPLVAKLIVGLGIGVLLMTVITGYQLLNLYEKEIIFSARNVRLLGRIGWLVFGYGLLGVSGQALFSTWHAYVGVAGSLPNAVLRGVHAFLGSPWIVGGLFLVMISHIMDEGRKVQEEQELTV